jgi:hypothetical protein
VTRRERRVALSVELSSLWREADAPTMPGDTVAQRRRLLRSTLTLFGGYFFVRLALFIAPLSPTGHGLARAISSVVMILISLRLAAGGLARRALAAPLVFLVTRWPVLIVWAFASSGILAAWLPRMILQGHDSLFDVLRLGAISLAYGFCAPPLVVGPIFFLVCAVRTAPTFPLEAGERVVEELSANHFLNGEARGGKLLLTTRRLGFRPHRFNVQRATWSVTTADIRELTIEGTRLLVVHTSRATAPEWIFVKRPERVVEKLKRGT